jgi:hypothetical protein
MHVSLIAERGVGVTICPIKLYEGLNTEERCMSDRIEERDVCESGCIRD